MALIGAVWTAYNSLAILCLEPLTLATLGFSHQVSSYFRATFEFRVWNIGNIWFANAILIGLVGFGFLTATRGQRWLKYEVFESATARPS